MSKWIRDNLVLVSGIVLPVLLVIGFFILNNLPRMMADPPRHDFLVIGYQYNYQNPVSYHLEFEVREGKLNGRVLPADANGQYANRQHAVIFVYRVAEERYEQITFDLPKNLDPLPEPVALDLGKAAELTLDKRIQSPDGYQFEFQPYQGRGGILGEIFGMNRRYESNYVLKKGSNYVNLPDPSIDPYYYQNDLQFMGWIVEPEAAP
jgi:hypothetical protein